MEYLTFIYPDWTKEAEQTETQKPVALNTLPNYESEDSESDAFAVISEDCDRDCSAYPTLYF